MSSAEVDPAGEMLFSFVRFWSRRWSGPNDTERAERGRLVLAVETVSAIGHRGEVTVNDVAAELGLDQSNASRLITRAAEGDYVVLGRSTTDRRRRTVRLTSSGEQLLADAHAWQNEAFAALTVDWTPAERLAFARAMRRLTVRSSDLEPIQKLVISNY